MGTLSAILSNTLQVTLTQNSLSERLEVATLNTLLGVITVFSVLILLILLIYMFRIFPYIEGKKKDKQKAIISSNTTEPVIKTNTIIKASTKNEMIDLTDNLELVAVITAAISASMGEAVPADGLVVRSIRKVNKRR
ncbi:MAG TPA: OadG family protein [Clostridiales bacterium]|nr:OadG family protein [Clostridiales bacterium]